MDCIWTSESEVMRDISRITGNRNAQDIKTITGKPPTIQDHNDDEIEEMKEYYCLTQNGGSAFESKPDLSDITKMVHMVREVDGGLPDYYSSPDWAENRSARSTPLIVSKMNPDAAAFVPNGSHIHNGVVEEVAEDEKKKNNDAQETSQTECDSKNATPLQSDTNQKQIESISKKFKEKVKQSKGKNKAERNVALVSLMKLHSSDPPTVLLTPDYFEKKSEVVDTVETSTIAEDSSDIAESIKKVETWFDTSSNAGSSHSTVEDMEAETFNSSTNSDSIRKPAIKPFTYKKKTTVEKKIEPKVVQPVTPSTTVKPSQYIPSNKAAKLYESLIKKKTMNEDRQHDDGTIWSLIHKQIRVNAAAKKS